jgi:crotonobetainyl-CoA:carnitine CoA-transferase CaiB-like acyl-CoA transferase
LGDWGADVIKVEHPVRGDPIRGLVTAGIVPGAKGVNFFTEQLGRNKRSVGIDLLTDAGREILYRLIEKADIFLTNYLPEARRKLQITYEDLTKINPSIIYAKGHGQGQNGPDANRGGYDAASFWARGGVADRLSTPGQPLVGQRPAFGDFIGGVFIAGGIAGALFHRQRTGQGIEVDVSLLGDAVWIMSPDIVAAMAYGFELPQSGVMGNPNPLVNTYWSSDGKGIVLMMLQADRFWPIFCKAMHREDLLQDARFNPPEQRHQHGVELTEELKQMFATKTRAEWAELLNASECIWAPVQSPLEVIEDRQVKANGYIREFDHPNFGSFRVAASPIQFNGEPPEVRSAAPDVGEHTEEVLLDLGYDWDAMGKLKEAGVIS